MVIQTTNLVFEGKWIFDIIYEGSRYSDYEAFNGPQEFEGINWENIAKYKDLASVILQDLSLVKGKMVST